MHEWMILMIFTPNSNFTYVLQVYIQNKLYNCNITISIESATMPTHVCLDNDDDDDDDERRWWRTANNNANLTYTAWTIFIHKMK